MILPLAIFAQSTQPHVDSLVDLYAKGLRAPLITGFFTLTGASIALGAFVWARMKDVVYDKPEYQNRVRSMRAFNPGLSAVGPSFRFLYHVLGTAVLLLASAILQATLGFRETKSAVLICLITGGTALLSLLITLILGIRNAIVWHAFSERTASANTKPKHSAPV